MWPQPTSLATMWTQLWALLFTWCFLLFCGACCSSPAPLSFYPGAICTCMQTDLPVPALSCQSVCRAGRGCSLWLILDLLVSTNFWRSATKHGAFSIVGAEKGYVVRVLDSKSMQISVWEVRFTSKTHESPVFVAFVYPKTRQWLDIKTS